MKGGRKERGGERAHGVSTHLGASKTSFSLDLWNMYSLPLLKTTKKEKQMH